ncbi:MAG: hypothetical protein E7422_01185 [Ruminococcaceae bacterium]|nr:hypothetical protein [Oscillospiraceae bacterium]
MENESKKLLLCARVGIGLLAALLVAVCVISAVLVPKTLRTLARVDETLAGIDALTGTAEDALTAANAAADSANKLLAENADAVSEAMDKFNSVDFDSLNKAIKDLADIVEPLAKVSNFFNQ